MPFLLSLETPYPAQLRLPSRHRDRAAAPHRHNVDAGMLDTQSYDEDADAAV